MDECRRQMLQLPCKIGGHLICCCCCCRPHAGQGGQRGRSRLWGRRPVRHQRRQGRRRAGRDARRRHRPAAAGLRQLGALDFVVGWFEQPDCAGWRLQTSPSSCLQQGALASQSLLAGRAIGDRFRLSSTHPIAQRVSRRRSGHGPLSVRLGIPAWASPRASSRASASERGSGCVEQQTIRASPPPRSQFGPTP
jgi:hypothetical protein